MIFSFGCHVVAVSTLLTIFTFLPSSLTNACACFALFASFLFVSNILGNILDSLPRFRVSAKKKAVFVTGCDTGFGHLLANRLDSIGYKVFAGVLHPSGEDAQRLKNCSSNKLTLLEVDVTDDRSVSEARSTIERNLGDCELWAIVNNAGIIVRGELEWTPIEDYRKLLDVNSLGPVRVAKAFLPQLRKSKGRIVTTTSFAGQYALPGLGTYCMSKHAAKAFCNGLRLEMEKFNVKVISVGPFSYKTAMTDVDPVLKSATDAWNKAPEDLKSEYGYGYIDAFRKSLERFSQMSVNENVHDVIDTLVEAVTVVSPHYHYTVGNLKSVVSFWFIQRLPGWMADLIVRYWVTFESEVTHFVRKDKNQLVTNGKKIH